MPYDTDDLRSQLPTEPKRHGVNVAPHYFEFALQSPTETTIAGSDLWWVRSQAVVTNFVRARAGDELTRYRQLDEYVVLVYDRDATITITEGSTSHTTAGGSLIVMPPGDGSITVDRDTELVRFFSTQSPDLCNRCINAQLYRERDPNVAPWTPWPDPPGGHRVRTYRLDDFPESPTRFGRIFRCSTFMVNVFYEAAGPRDPAKLSPHSHDDFEQLSLQLAGDYVHHIRTPWVPDRTAWRDDEHRRCTSPSLTVQVRGTWEPDW
jgi:hypothetical protein